MNEITDKAVELLDKLDKLTTQYAPDVVAKAVDAVQITAIGNLIQGVFGIFAAALAIFLTAKAVSLFNRLREEDGYMSNWELASAFAIMCGVGSSIIFSVSSIFCLINIWNWVGAYNPELALAHKILGL